MFLNTWKARLCGLALCLVCGAYATSAKAGTLTVQFSGMDLVYDGTNLFDAKASNVTGAGNPAEADKLTTMTFWLDDEIVGSTLTSNIFADVFIKDLTGIPAAGGVVTSSGNGDGFGFDLLTSNGSPGWGLALNIDTVSLFYTGGGITMAATGVASSVFSQTLPFGLEYDVTKPITFVVSSTAISNITTANGVLTGFRAASTGEVNGVTAVPLPSAAWAGLGLLGALGVNRVRKARNA